MRREPWMNIFDAFGDPTRRLIFERLWRRPMPVGELAQGLPVTRSAVSQHLKVFKDLGLLRVRTDGVRRIYSVEPAGLWPLRSWVEGHMPSKALEQGPGWPIGPARLPVHADGPIPAP
jgi:DNA-binding transcriptional ArsR family regulator